MNHKEADETQTRKKTTTKLIQLIYKKTHITIHLRKQKIYGRL